MTPATMLLVTIRFQTGQFLQLAVDELITHGLKSIALHASEATPAIAVRTLYLALAFLAKTYWANKDADTFASVQSQKLVLKTDLREEFSAPVYLRLFSKYYLPTFAALHRLVKPCEVGMCKEIEED